MIVIYNGVRLESEQVIQCDLDPVYDRSGADYLYHHLRLCVRAVWHPRATANSGKTAAESINDLTTVLQAPRKQLRLTVPSGGAGGEKVLLISPLRDIDGNPFSVDAKNGPIPGPLKIVQIIGERMAIVDFTCESWINLCSTGRAMVSHRWQMSNDLDQDFWTTRTITGEMIFRTDMLATFNVWPDTFRQFIHPIPDGFQRVSVHVEQSTDGTALAYTVVDKEQPLRISNNRISRIEGTYFEGLTGLKYDLSDVPGSVRVGARTGRDFGAFFGSGGEVAGSVIGAGLGIIASPLRAITFPTMSRGIVVEIWGSPRASRMDLVNALARAAAAYNLGTVNIPVPGGVLRLPTEVLSGTRLFSDIYGKHARMEVSFENGSAAQIVALRALGLIPGVNGRMPENIVGVASTVGPTSNPPNDFNTRGTWIANLWSQLLQNQCAAPAVPPQQVNEAG